MMKQKAHSSKRKEIGRVIPKALVNIKTALSVGSHGEDNDVRKDQSEQGPW